MTCMRAAILDNVRTYVPNMLNGVDELPRHHHLSTPVRRSHFVVAGSVVAFRVDVLCIYVDWWSSCL